MPAELRTSPERRRANRLRSATGLSLTASLALMASAAAAQQRTIPTLETEDAQLGSMQVGAGALHPFFSTDVRNGDYARGSYDDDASNLARVPFHAELGLAIDRHASGSGTPDAFLVLESSNGFHSPSAGETTSPRFWYESNNLVGLVVKPADGLTVALSYTNKRSPNEVAGISHEISVSLAYEGRSPLGSLHPTLEMTGRPADGRGAYTQVGVEPRWKLSRSEQAAELSLPAHFGVGWGGFYQAGTGTVAYGDVGLAASQPFKVGARSFRMHAELLALIRDPTLRSLDGDSADRATVVPLATIGVSTAF